MSDVQDKVGAWLIKFFEADDSLDISKLEKYIDSDVIQTVGNGAVSKGKEQVIKGFQSSFATLDILKHDIEFWDVAGNRVWTRLNVTHVLKADPEKQRRVVRAHAVFTIEEDPTTEYRIREMYICVDLSPVTQRFAELGVDLEALGMMSKT
ncbi:hypothetical protein BDZ85DRAFT_322542 [Elsinoe ampelina]|uniref:SnoaL-like domain-containing protein n=1 Tax=Elsinoe ampelina TaxID=302913 RepID=A0A6A6G0F1_9PEZI|nr:hypothetical protein BDZ85DRAFT_322542 [Elsinoe ampelina]